MFKEKVNARTDGQTDNGPWHKLAGLRPVELKNATHPSWKHLKMTWNDQIWAKICKFLDWTKMNHMQTKKNWENDYFCL